MCLSNASFASSVSTMFAAFCTSPIGSVVRMSMPFAACLASMEAMLICIWILMFWLKSQTHFWKMCAFFASEACASFGSALFHLSYSSIMLNRQ